MHRAGSFLVAFVTIGAAAAVAPPPALKSLTPPGLRIGVALNRAQSDGADPGALAIATQQFDSITSENLLKWGLVHPQLDRYDFGPADRFVELGRAHRMFVVGHVLV